MSEAEQSPGLVHRAGREFSERARAGGARLRGDILQALQLTVAAIGAFVFAENVLGHTGPIFAATAATGSATNSSTETASSWMRLTKEELAPFSNSRRTR